MSGCLCLTNGWTRLASGMLIKWGTVTGIAQATTTAVVFPTGAAIPAFSVAPYNIQLTSVKAVAGLSTHASVVEMTVATTGFSLYVEPASGSGSNYTVFYYAIGI